MSEMFEQALARFDEVNARDPRSEMVHGESVPKELIYGRRMSERLSAFAPDASVALKLAARGQHIARYEIPRDQYPKNRIGYLRWRTDLYKHHADTAQKVLEEVGYDSETIDRVRSLLQKKNLKRDPETQTLEDVACLVFLEHYMDAFEETQDEEKMVQIVQKTWNKMSERGRKAALGLEVSDRVRQIVDRALLK